ncbi:MAG: cofactor-independent phosphoglycerate mutase [Desulfobacterota bacterium]|nr:cofactor-independent phosphoglycerate mutase [Thermodesulfobacteriota bacterium]
MAQKEKYIVIVGDGMADYPVEALQGKTPLRVAKTPHLDWLARHGTVGMVRTIPDGFNPGSEIANLSIFGYDPSVYFTGRGPLEAASLGLILNQADLAFRCNLVTLRREGSKTVMEDFAAGHISDDEAARLIEALDRQIGRDGLRFFSGVSYRHLLIMRDARTAYPGLETLKLTPPHDLIGQPIDPFLPKDEGPGAKILELMAASQKILGEHPVNLERRKKGLRPANSIWLWGQGGSPQMPTLRERFGVEGYVISAVHLIRGIGLLAGLEVLPVPGITGYFDTNYRGKGEYSLKGLRERDFVYVHVEAPDEAGHQGDLRLKIEAIEAFDEKVVGTILQGMEAFERLNLLVLPDHPTPLSVRTHTPDPVPFVVYSNHRTRSRFWAEGFDEERAAQTGLFVEKGHELIEKFLMRPLGN